MRDLASFLQLPSNLTINDIPLATVWVQNSPSRNAIPKIFCILFSVTFPSTVGVTNKKQGMGTILAQGTHGNS